MCVIVCKFGGTSIASASQIIKLARIVRSDSRRRYIVVSAPGKRNRADSKVTDLLYYCHDLASGGKDISSVLSSVRERYIEIADSLSLSTTLPLVDLLNEIEMQIRRGAGRDYVVSRGEYLSAHLIAHYLGAVFVETQDKIKIEDDGRVADSCYKVLHQAMPQPGLYVIPGFYGQGADGQVQTFPRGGSDITGAVVSRAVNAGTYENWTDVSGCLAADPRIVPGVITIKTLTYREIHILSLMGTNVLHEESIYPVFPLGIPINIRNTNEPSDPGTLIVPDREPENGSLITGITGKKGYTLVMAEMPLVNTEPDVRERISALLKAKRVKLFQLLTGPSSLTVIYEYVARKSRNQDLFRSICKVLNTDSVKIMENLAVIAIVGHNFPDYTGVVTKVSQALAQKKINLRFLEAGSSNLCVTLGVENIYFESAIKSIYRAFFGEV